MSAQQLRVDIARLTEAIDPLKTVLVNLRDQRAVRCDPGRSDRLAVATGHLESALAALETDRKESIRHLSASRAPVDPVARLPREISTRIFLHLLPFFFVDDAANLLQVCRAWTKIAQATPGLWTHINSGGTAPGKFKNILKLWLSRAQRLPVSLVLDHVDSPIRDIVEENSHRIHDLAFLLRPEQRDNWEEEIAMISERCFFDALRSLTIQSSADVDTGLGSLLDSPRHTLNMLRGMPKLEEFTFLFTFYKSRLQPNTTILTLPSLRRLSLGKFETEYGHPKVADGQIIGGLRLPALEFLHIRLNNPEDETHLFHMLDRSSPPLNTLQISINGMSATVFACLHSVPRVTQLDIAHSLHDKITSRLFDALASTPSLLPDLRHLRVFGLIGGPSVYASVLKALRHRKSRLRSFRFIILGEMTRSLPDAFEPAFRELIAGGMDIFIATDWKRINYLL
ncbi:hypothetical protein FB45DRAFT_428932 [Roridomyces roridus]|uniref:F-box domain-containing protein n=1 Tax=Roridomyces roridus TaxID=1738132 RepID=A0AAD7FVS1_9AGAR|nr:hypothetical protein FB45DRAFT_428932 [Roridomyces roridus]